MFTQRDKNIYKQKTSRFSKEEALAAGLERRKQGLGIPVHIKIPSDECNIDEYTPFVLDRVLHNNYIALAIDPFLG